MANASANTQISGSEVKTAYPRIYNKIVLTLENSLIPESKLEETPSRSDGLDAETEKDLRILGCELIQTAGILLKLPQVAMATGQVLFQRFFYSKSFILHNMETVAMSCICLASKIEEAQRRIRDVINVFNHIKQVRSQKQITPMILDQYYTNLKAQIIKAERRVLKELGFCVHVKHPHKLIVMYLKVLKYEKHQKLMQMAWNFMNDSLRTDAFMRYNPETIACACIYLSARKLSIPLPTHPYPWYGVFQAKEDSILDICYRVMELYTRAKPNVEKLETVVEELRKQHMESRNKAKEHNTPPTVTTVDRSNGSHNAWGGFIQRMLPQPLPKESKPAEKEARSRSRSRPRDFKRASRSRSRPRSLCRVRSHSHSPPSHRTKKTQKERKQPRSCSATPEKAKKRSRHYSPPPVTSSITKHSKRKSSPDRYLEKHRDKRDKHYTERDKYYLERDKHYAERDKQSTYTHRTHHSSSSTSKHQRFYSSSHRSSNRESTRQSRSHKR